MNCSHCKNPVFHNASECEWCGYYFSSSNTGSYVTVNFYLKASRWHPSVVVMVFVDGVLIKEFLVTDGCDFDFKLSSSKPEISISLNGGKNIHKIPEYNFDFKYQNYRLKWTSNFFNMIRFNKPVILPYDRLKILRK